MRESKKTAYGRRRHAHSLGRIGVTLGTSIVWGAISLAQPSFGGPISGFSDLGGHLKEAPAIERMTAQGVIVSAAGKGLELDRAITRVEFVSSVQRLFKLSVPEKTLDFSDVAPTSPSYSAIQAVAPYMG